jgi:hypothetical protein
MDRVFFEHHPFEHFFSCEYESRLNHHAMDATVCINATSHIAQIGDTSYWYSILIPMFASKEGQQLLREILPMIKRPALHKYIVPLQPSTNRTIADAQAVGVASSMMLHANDYVRAVDSMYRTVFHNRGRSRPWYLDQVYIGDVSNIRNLDAITIQAIQTPSVYYAVTCGGMPGEIIDLFNRGVRSMSPGRSPPELRLTDVMDPGYDDMSTFAYVAVVFSPKHKHVMPIVKPSCDDNFHIFNDHDRVQGKTSHIVSRPHAFRSHAELREYFSSNINFTKIYNKSVQMFGLSVDRTTTNANSANSSNSANSGADAIVLVLSLLFALMLLNLLYRPFRDRLISMFKIETPHRAIVPSAMVAENSETSWATARQQVSTQVSDDTSETMSRRYGGIKGIRGISGISGISGINGVSRYTNVGSGFEEIVDGPRRETNNSESEKNTATSSRR